MSEKNQGILKKSQNSKLLSLLYAISIIKETVDVLQSMTII